MADEWDGMTPMGTKEAKRGKTTRVIFRNYSNGLKTRRDDWVYNSSIEHLAKHMTRHINYCNTQDPDNFVINPKYAKKTVFLIDTMKKMKYRNEKILFNRNFIHTSLYRPFMKQFVYYDKIFIHEMAQIPKFFPTADTENRTILVPDKIKGEFSTMISDIVPDLHIHEASQAFSLKTVIGNKGTREQGNKGTREQGNKGTREQGNASPTYHNPSIIVPDKIKDEFSVFITDITPDLEVVHHSQVFPMKVMEK